MNTAGLLSANPSYIPFELRNIVTRAINTLTSSLNKVHSKLNKRQEHAAVTDKEKSTVSASATPVKHKGKKGMRAAAKQKLVQLEELHDEKQKLVQLEELHEDETMVDPDATKGRYGTRRASSVPG